MQTTTINLQCFNLQWEELACWTGRIKTIIFIVNLKVWNPQIEKKKKH